MIAPAPRATPGQSHYFQQLLTSSGLMQPVILASASPASFSASPADLTEIHEEMSATPPAATMRPTPEPTREFVPASSTRASQVTLDSRTNPAPVLSAPGVVEIISSAAITATTPTPATTALRPLAPTPPPAHSPTSFPPGISVEPIAVAHNAPATDLVSPAGKSTTPSAALIPERLPTSDELIQHVLRWVGQNPTHITPPELKLRPATQSKDSAPTESTSSTAAPTIRLAPVLATQEIIRPAPAPAAPANPPPARAQSAPPAPEAVAPSVEISIGTLQIQVEAAPAPAAKPPRRPAPPRNSGAPKYSPAISRPPVDLNRLRRGFYL
jgi:hypothetical protein